MSKKPLAKLNPNVEKIAAENCCVEQIVNSIFDHVACDENKTIENRSDHQEIVRFSESLLENELIFGSPSEDVVESAMRKISSKSEKSKIS